MLFINATSQMLFSYFDFFLLLIVIEIRTNLLKIFCEFWKHRGQVAGQLAKERKHFMNLTDLVDQLPQTNTTQKHNYKWNNFPALCRT